MIDDPSGEVVEAWTGDQVDTPLARGYEGAVAGIANTGGSGCRSACCSWLPFFDPRRPFRLLHLDLLVLLGLSVSLIFFNRAEIGVSVPLVYPVLGYVFVRMLLAGFDRGRERGSAGSWCRCSAPELAGRRRSSLLAVFHIGYHVDRGQGDRRRARRR